MPTAHPPYRPNVPTAAAVDAVYLVAEARGAAYRVRQLLGGARPAATRSRRRAGDLVVQVSECLRVALDDPTLTPASARYLADMRDAVDAHLVAAGDAVDETFAVHHHRLLLCAAELVFARLDSASLRLAG